MNRNYKKGIKAENKVAASLKRKGATVQQSPGSRGAADLKANFGNGKKWNIQVKSSKDGSNSPSKHELTRLKISAARSKAIPVVAKVVGGKTEYRSARNGRKLKP